NYQGTAEQKKKRASRNSARSAMVKAGKVRKGDGKDVDHKNGNPKDNSKKNLRVTSKGSNRSFPRNSKAGKK
ncbi:MAG: HNH endonuclease, partial [Gammaproteobacteria bacterium]|uniref:HNH endonuclease n=1 Tax=Herbaspirillum sp. TaxID=1890675 RepID=UPI002584A1AE